MDHLQSEKFDRFCALHTSGRAFVMPNAWDAGSARILSALGFRALATTSAGYAMTLGRRDSNAGLSRAEVLENAAAIIRASDLPVSADLEDGFGPDPKHCADTIHAAITCGLVGGSIEDMTGNDIDPIYDRVLASERIAAAAEATLGQPFLLTARAENYLWGRPDLADTIGRLQAYSDAGAAVLYAPGLRDIDEIATLCRELDKPVNVVMGLTGPALTVAQLEKAGVTRISVGGSFARAALGGLLRAAREVLEEGSFTYAADALPDSELRAMMADFKIDDRG